jgi:hypothetical protein
MDDSNTLNTSSESVFNLQETYKRQLEHLVWMSQIPGAKAHAWSRAKELDSDVSGVFKGIAADLTREMLEIHNQNAKKDSA